MRVYFAAAGMGLGHVGRIVPIARRLQQRNHADILFSTYQDGITYAEHENLPLIRAPSISVQVKPDGRIDFRRTAANPGPFLASLQVLNQINAEVKSIQNFSPDVVVSDSRASSIIAARILRVPRICILNQFQVIVPRRQHHLFLARLADSVTLALLGKIWTSRNTVLIPDFPEPYTISAGNLMIPRAYRRNVHLIGPILPVHPDALEPKEKLRERLGLPEDKPVIFAPISGPTKEKAFLSKLLSKTLYELPEQYSIIVSLGYPDGNIIPKRRGNVTVFDWIANRFEYLKACDLVISRAGHGTITQSMCYGKPMILIPTLGHTEQLINAYQAWKLGFATVLMQNQLTKRTLENAVGKALSRDFESSILKIRKTTLSNDGLKNAVQMIERACRN